MASPNEIGKRFEYRVEKILSKWSGRAFKRSPNSGALRWKTTHWTFGDLVPPEDFTFVIECKTADSAESFLMRLLSPDCATESDSSSSFCSWWYRQAVPDAERASEQLGQTFGAMLIWRETHRAEKVCLDAEVYSRLPEAARAKLAAFWVCLPNKRPFMIVDAAAFFQQVSYEVLTELPLALSGTAN